MKSIFDDQSRASLGARLDRMTFAHAPKWGRMTCDQMLAHLTDNVRLALGEFALEPRRGPLRWRPVRHLVIHWAPFPKGAPTAPELIERRADDCGSEVAALKAAMERMSQRTGGKAWVEHPAFGSMTERDWGVLIYRHVDHHLRQFGE